MMRILLDADAPVQMLEPLRHTLPSPLHTVRSVHELRWSAKKDVALLRDARTKFDVLVTNDINQLDSPDETAAIRKSGLHHVLYRQRHPGLQGLALAIGAVVAAMPAIIEHLSSIDGQRLIHVAGLDPKNRYKSVDPLRNPPRYWR